MSHFRCIINGTTPAPGEVWSVGLSYLSDAEAVGFTTLDAWAASISANISALAANTLVQALSNGGAITKIRVEERSDADETLVLAAERVLGAPKTGANTPDKVLQAAICISLLTGQPGRSYRGRVYWPAWAFSPDAQLLFGVGSRTGWITAFKAINDLIEAAALTADPLFEIELAVRSRLLHSSTRVQFVAIGSVPDVQRRRRDALTELYSSATV